MDCWHFVYVCVQDVLHLNTFSWFFVCIKTAHKFQFVLNQSFCFCLWKMFVWFIWFFFFSFCLSAEFSFCLSYIFQIHFLPLKCAALFVLMRFLLDDLCISRSSFSQRQSRLYFAICHIDAHELWVLHHTKVMKLYKCWH